MFLLLKVFSHFSRVFPQGAPNVGKIARMISSKLLRLAIKEESSTFLTRVG